MKKYLMVILAAGLFAACNSSSSDKSKTDSTSTNMNTNMTDTGMGSSMSDTTHRMDSNMKMDTSKNNKY
jgi:uncharacterized protein YcfL